MTEHPSQSAAGHGRAPLLLVLLLLGFAIGHAAWRMQLPLTGLFPHGFVGANAARYSLAGRNYERHGLTENLLAPDFTPGNPEVDRRFLYLHHPPLVPLVVGVSFIQFGESERSAMLPFFVIGLLVLPLFFLVARHCLRGIGPAAATLLVAVVPMTGVYGGHVDPQGPLLVLSLLGLTLFYLRFRRSGSGLDLAGMIALLFLGLLTDWPAAYLAGLIPVVDLLLRGGRRDRRIWALPALAVGLFGLMLLWVSLLDWSLWEAVFEPASMRTSLELVEIEGEQLAAAGQTFLTRALDLFTAPLLILAALGLIPLLSRSAAREGGAFGATLAILGGTGLIHIVLFPQGALVHDYWTFLLLPALGLLAGRFVEAVRRKAAAMSGEGFGVLLTLLLCGGAAWIGDRATREYYQVGEDPENELRCRFGQLIREQVRPHHRVLTNVTVNPGRSDLLMFPEFTYYADRVVRGAIKTRADLDRATAEEGPFDRYVYLPSTVSPEPPIVAELLQSIEPERPNVGVDLLVFDLAGL